MTKPTANTAIIIVAFNSERCLPKAMHAIATQTVAPRQVIIVDAGSHDTRYLDKYCSPTTAIVKPGSALGFCQANNIGYQHVASDCDYILLLNPDAFLSETFLERAVAHFEDPSYWECGALTGMALGYDLDNDIPTGTYDSTGVFHTWYGRWYDRGQGESIAEGRYSAPEAIPAITGALFFIRKEALDSILYPGRNLFDPSFFMYKEDIDLSLRLRNHRWTLYYFPDLVAHHCRGWDTDRSAMSRSARVSSARNELWIHRRERKVVPTLYSLAKYAAVKWFDQ
ncbi:MAG: glycosyltransferase family 2 protein [Chlamydiales bacterium]|nr:glycosyltransferase family 2 protein [Chlamydiia bacterium]MCP5508025.1 glycosyltransferase family 2 protein [Chlamydiales bacterium]